MYGLQGVIPSVRTNANYVGYYQYSCGIIITSCLDGYCPSTLESWKGLEVKVER